MKTNSELLAELGEARAIRRAAEDAFATANDAGQPTEAIERTLMAAERLIAELLGECLWREEHLRKWRWP